MAYSKIEIDFFGVPEVNDVLNIRETSRGLVLNQEFRRNRLGPGQTRTLILQEAGDYVGFISFNYRTAFNLDYNASNLFTLVATSGPPHSGVGIVTITANYPNAVFVLDDYPNATVTITNEVTEPPYEISSIYFSTDTEISRCQNVKVEVSTNQITKKILQPTLVENIDSDSFNFTFLRGQHFTLVVENENGTTTSKNIDTPGFLAFNESNLYLQINNSPNGATVVCNVQEPDSLDLEFSLDGIAWQQNNVFSGLDVGDYTLYIQDQFGCKFQKDFNVDSFGIYSPFFYISKSNPIRYAQRVDWGTGGNYKTDENTLSSEVDVKSVGVEVQQFQTSDIVPTQFKSNYQFQEVTVIKQDKSEVNIPVVKKTTNIGNKEKRDAIKYSYESGKTGIYFMSGNQYNFDTNGVTGSYTLNGFVPYWGKAGNYIEIEGAWFLIEDVVFDDGINAEVLLISQNYTGSPTAIIVGCVFNYQDYEVYEYNIDMLQFIDTCIQVRLKCTDPHFTDIIYLSEIISVKVFHPQTLEIKYRNKDNTDVYYATGIEFLIRQLYTKMAGIPDQKSENMKTDTNVVLLNADIYEVKEITFEPTSEEMMRKLIIALSHESVFINNVGYVKNDSVDVEGPLDESNLYVVKAKMIKNGFVYNSQSAGSGSEIINGENLEIPGLIDYGGGFVKY